MFAALHISIVLSIIYHPQNVQKISIQTLGLNSGGRLTYLDLLGLLQKVSLHPFILSLHLNFTGVRLG